MTTGPTNALAVVVASVMAPFTQDGGDYVERLVTLTVLVGVIELALGLVRMGALVRYVATSVMTGFVTGTALLVILGQLAHLTGITTGAGNALVNLGELVRRTDQLHPETLLIGLATIAIIVALHRTRLLPFATLVAIVITGAAVALLGWHERGVELVIDLSPIPNALPGAVRPEPDYVDDMFPSALALALLGLVQTAALAQSVAKPEDGPPDSSREFIVQGVSNLFGGLFQNMPASGSLSRTAVNVKSGARTRWANVFAGVFVALIMLLFGGWAERIALAALAGHLIVAATALIDVHQMRFIWRASVAGRWAMIATLVSTLILPLQYSVYVGVALSLLHYIEESSRIRLTQLEPLPAGRYREIPPPHRLPDAQPVLLSLQGNLAFAAMRELFARLPDPSRAQRPVVILRMRGDTMLAGTGVAVLMAYHRQLRARGGKLILSGVAPKTYDTLVRTGAADLLGADNIFGEEEVLFSATQKALAYAQHWLAAQETPAPTPPVPTAPVAPS